MRAGIKREQHALYYIMSLALCPALCGILRQRVLISGQVAAHDSAGKQHFRYKFPGLTQRGQLPVIIPTITASLDYIHHPNKLPTTHLHAHTRSLYATPVSQLASSTHSTVCIIQQSSNLCCTDWISFLVKGIHYFQFS